MKTRTFTDPLEALDHLKTLGEGDNTIEVTKTQDGLYCVSWLENVTYVSFTGETHIDEVWTKEDGTMIAVQNLELAHAHNIIRMILRNERERNKATALIIDQLENLFNAVDEAVATDADTDPNRILH